MPLRKGSLKGLGFGGFGSFRVGPVLCGLFYFLGWDLAVESSNPPCSLEAKVFSWFGA